MTEQQAIQAWVSRPLPPIESLRINPSDLIDRQFTVADIEQMVNRERDYRRGYSHGIADCVRWIIKLKKSGFIRPQEIANIIGDHLDMVVMPWRFRASKRSEVVKPGYGYTQPSFSHATWPQIRQQVFERDGQVCAICGSEHNLEVDHILAVANGGLPILENLQILCCPCNNKKQ